MLHVSKGAIVKAFYFKKAPELIIMEIAEALSPKFFARREPLHSIRHSLSIIERGTVAHGGFILVPGQVFQEDFIIRNLALQSMKPTSSLTFTLLLTLHRDSFFSIVEHYPSFASHIKKCATKLALCRIIAMCAAKHRTHQALTGSGLSLVEAFSSLDYAISEDEKRARAAPEFSVAMDSMPTHQGSLAPAQRGPHPHALRSSRTWSA